MTRKKALTPVSGGEMLHAAGEVVAARLRILAEGLADPRKADLREMSLMGTEKVEAMAASAAAVGRTLGEIGGRLGGAVAAEAGIASRAAADMAAADSPAALAQAQFSYAVGWWSRAAGQALTLNADLLKAHAEAMRPIHRAATANAKRLKR